MKNYLLHIIMFTFVVACLSGLTGKIAAEGIRIVPQSITVKNDSLHLWLEMDLNSVHVNSLAAVIFTPNWQEKGSSQKITLPSVVITGGKRFRFERRERALATSAENREIPYLILLDNNQIRFQNVRYRISIPYTSWMQQASLLLRQEIKDCCDLQLLGVDTLKRNLSVSTVQLAKTTPFLHPMQNRIRTNPFKETTMSRVRVREQISLNTADVNTYASMVSFLTPDPKQENKHRSKSTTLYIDYPLGKMKYIPTLKQPGRDRQDRRQLASILAEGYLELERIEVKGYASPDGNYGDNEKLAATVPGCLPGMCKSVRHPRPPVRRLIRGGRLERPGRFAAKHETLLLYGSPRHHTPVWHFQWPRKTVDEFAGEAFPYKDMLKGFSCSRRIEFVVEYRIRALNAEEASEMIYIHPTC